MPDTDPRNPVISMSRRTLLVSTVLSEAALFLIGLLGIRLAGISPTLGLEAIWVVAGVATGLVLTLAVALLLRSQAALLNRLHDDLATVIALFREISAAEVALVSLLAGVGEEVLFRGFLQGWMTELAGPHLAIIVVALAFGLLHAISRSYAVYAAILGLALGYLYYLTGSLAAVMIAHGVYDFAAIMYGRKLYR